MPYILCNADGSISTMSIRRPYIDTEIGVTNITRNGFDVHIDLADPIVYENELIRNARITGASNNSYNGDFYLRKISDTSFAYKLGCSLDDQPEGTVKLIVSLPDESYQYIDGDDEKIGELTARIQTRELIRNKKNLLAEGDYRIIRHMEEVLAGIDSSLRTLSDQEIYTIHQERKDIRDEINVLEQNT